MAIAWEWHKWESEKLHGHLKQSNNQSTFISKALNYIQVYPPIRTGWLHECTEHFDEQRCPILELGDREDGDFYKTGLVGW